MASLDQERQTPCMGHDVLVDGCPVGTTLRIVADEWRDLLDEDLEQLCSVNSECEGLDGLAQRGWDLTAFCEVDADVGCLDCPAWSLRPGTICGLHGRFNMSLLSDPPDVRAGDDAVLADLRRIGEFVDARLRIGFRESLVQADRNHGPLVERLLQPAQCLGVDVTMHGCPPPLRMTCSSDLLNGEPWRLSPTPDPLGADLLAPAINRAGLCWCDLPTAQQVWKEVLITADAALDDQGRLVLSAERTGGFRSDGRLGDVRFELRFTQGSLEASGTPTADHPGSTAELRRAELSAVPTWNVIVSTDPFPQGPVRVRLPVTLTAQEARVVVQVRDAAVDDGSFVNLGLLNEVVLRP